MPERDASEDTRLLVAYLREAGAIARHYFGGTFKVTNKSNNSPVTDADLAIDKFLHEKLLAQRPDYGWLSEESTDDPARLNCARTFVVDPIDGTHGFIKRRPQFTIVAAVVVEGRPQSAAIYNPITEEMFEATLACGARKNGQPIHVSFTTDLADSRLFFARDVFDSPRWATPWPESVTVETRSSIAYRMGLVAAGEFDAMVSPTRKSDWDLAAGDLLVHEAGGTVTDSDGTLLIYNRPAPDQETVICATPALHGLLLARLKERT
ncbi:MAG: 3'(2'),5'-bisphosphate nucleotidase CysQ [Alphaproteobacteria bacterium]|nr:3'(2'),5'-bisphosphate nucleotidase CysQ [Alphaproteobacteria bacterium]